MDKILSYGLSKGLKLIKWDFKNSILNLNN
jgi:hypothetical protein